MENEFEQLVKQPTIEEIEQYVKEWTYRCIDKNFEFREHQLESICNIIQNILNKGNKHHIIEAPTGTGKSLIIMISAGVLSYYFNMSSYILVSDLTLWAQYETFLKKHKKTGIAFLKGQLGNYKCALNGEDITHGDCKLAGLSWQSMYNSNVVEKYGYQCSYTCEYIKQRRKAVKASVCLLTYQLFINIFRNFELDDNNPYQFKPHDIIFCDECHNIPNIVSMCCELNIKEDDFDKLMSLYKYEYNLKHPMELFSDDARGDDILPNDNLIDQLFNDWPESKLDDYFNTFWKHISDHKTRKDEDNKLLEDYNKLLIRFSIIVEDIQEHIYSLKTNKQPISKDDLKIYKICEWCSSYINSFAEFFSIILMVGNQYQLKLIDDVKHDNNAIVTLKCTKEDFLVYHFLLTKADYKVMLSATIGGHQPYNENMGFHYIEKNDPISIMDIVPSSFDFTESPIYFLNKFKMSLKERDISFRHLKTIIYSICTTKFKDQKGLIQTGSYQLAKELYEDAPLEVKKRILLYNGSREKNTCLQIHELSSNTILVGPTLNEGIDLPGEQCRFIIILKMPYPNLGDRYVKEKIKWYPLWYNSSTSNEIIQGIGRGVRFNGDWCVTYIFDACFWNLYKSTEEQYPQEIKDRLKII